MGEKLQIPRWEPQEDLLKEENGSGGQEQGCSKEWRKHRQRHRDVNQPRPFREL